MQGAFFETRRLTLFDFGERNITLAVDPRQVSSTFMLVRLYIQAQMAFIDDSIRSPSDSDLEQTDPRIRGCSVVYSIS